jgi:internalin A
MRTLAWVVLAITSLVALSCDEGKYDKYLTQPEALAPAPSAVPTPAPPPAPSATTAAWKKMRASDCKAHPAAIDFEGDTVLEAEVRRKVGKETSPITPWDLAQVKSLNLTSGHPHQIDPCIFPMFTSLKDLFLGPGEYDDIIPIQKLPLESLVLASSPVRDLHPIEGMKRLDRLDLSHTLIDDNALKAVGGLVNLTELMLDEDMITDLSPVAGLQKLERLSIKRTTVKSLQPLSGLRNLKFLYIVDSPVSDISPVQGLMAGGMKLIQK